MSLKPLDRLSDADLLARFMKCYPRGIVEGSNALCPVSAFFHDLVMLPSRSDLAHVQLARVTVSGSVSFGTAFRPFTMRKCGDSMAARLTTRQALLNKLRGDVER